MPLGDLPNELIHCIYLYLPYDHLYECMKVSTLWYREAAAIIYRDISLYNYHVRFLASTQTVHRDGTRLGDHVQSLTFKPKHTPEDQKLTQQQFKSLLNNLPQLQVIRFEPNGDLQTIIDYMIYYKTVARFTRVQQISIPDLEHSSKKIRKIRDLHYLANYVSHDHITELFLHNLDARKIIYDNDRFFKDLSKFKHLRHLSLNAYNLVNPFYSYNDINVTSILNACPSLESLNLTNTTPWKDFDSQRIYPYLTTLTLDGPEQNKANIEFLIERVPNLKRLSLKLKFEYSISGLYNTLSPVTASKFVSYIKQLDYLDLQGTSFRNDQDIELFWNLMQSLYDDTFRSNFLISFSISRTHSEILEFDRSRKTFNVRCEWMLQNDLRPDWTRYLCSFKFASLQIEYRDRIHKEPLLLDFMQPAFLEQQPFISFMANGVRIILDETTTSIVRGMKRFLDKPNIRCAYLSYLKPEHAVILPIIGAYYPSIQHITMIQCDLPKQDDCYLIDLTKFTDVHELTLDLEVILDVEPEIYIQVISEDKVKWYYVHHWSVKRLEDTPVEEEKAIIRIESMKLRHFKLQRDNTDMLMN